MDDGHDWEFVKRVTHPALILAPASFFDDICANLWAEGVQGAVAQRETAPIFDWLMRLVQLQGISDTIAFAYADKHAHARAREKGGAIVVLPQFACRGVVVLGRDEHIGGTSLLAES